VGFDLARRHETDHFGELTAIGLYRIAQRAHTMLDGLLLRRLRQCRHQYSAALQELPRALAGFAVDQVKYHIEISSVLFEALSLVVNDDISSETPCKIYIVR
jgi:hypothetical protein